MKNLSLTIALAILFAVTVSVATAAAEEEDRPVLKIFTWSDYMPEEIVEGFESRYGVEIQFSYYETDEERDVLLTEAGGRGYDLILVSDALLKQYYEQGWVKGLDPGAMPHLSDVEEPWQSVAAGGLHRAQPFAWGTFGIAYRADMVEEPIQSWMDLLDPQEALHGRIIMVADSWDLLTAALYGVGADPMAPTREDLRAAEKVLMAQKPHVKSYGYPLTGDDSELITGEVVAATAYNGDALMIQEFEENVEYVVPEEGSIIWVDYWALSAFCRDEALAIEFLSFIGEKENAALISEELYYASPYASVQPLLSDELREDTAVYPSADVLAKSFRYRKLNPRTVRSLAQIYHRVAR